MRITPVLALVAILAGTGHVIGVLLDRPALALPGGATALVALAAYAAVAGRNHPAAMRWSLVAGLLVLAGATAAGLVWDVSATRSQDFGWFAYEPLARGPRLPAPDLWHGRWVAALALVAYGALALAVARLPGSRGRTGAVAVSVIGAALLLGYGALGVWAASDTMPATAVEAIPASAAAAVALGAGMVAARRTGDGALLVWVGMILLAVPALRGAVDAVELAVTTEVLESYQDTDVTAATAYVWRDATPTALFAFPAFFAMLRLVAVGMVTVGAARRFAQSEPGTP